VIAINPVPHESRTEGNGHGTLFEAGATVRLKCERSNNGPSTGTRTDWKVVAVFRRRQAQTANSTKRGLKNRSIPMRTMVPMPMGGIQSMEHQRNEKGVGGERNALLKRIVA